MRLDEHRRYTQALLARLSARGDVIGLVALGSMAEQGELPDELSDHDFFVIVAPAAAEAYRERGDWLPDHEHIALRFRETPHGSKVLYRSGHLVEYAVFTPDEIRLARVNRYRVLLDRGDVDVRMQAVARETHARLERESPSDEWLVGQLLTEVLVAALRDVRGEHLSGSQRRQQATQHLLRLVARHVPSDSDPRRDLLDVSRRVELLYPQIARELHAAELTSPGDHVKCLLALAERELAPRMPGFPRDALALVRQRIDALALRPAS